MLSILNLAGWHRRLFPWAFSMLESIVTWRVLARRCPPGTRWVQPTGLRGVTGAPPCLGCLELGLFPFAWGCLWRQDKCPHTRLGAQLFSSLRSVAKPLQEPQKFGFSFSGYKVWESEVPTPPPASFVLLLDFGRSCLCLNPLHSCCGAATLSQAITATLQWLQEVAKDVEKLDFHFVLIYF